MSALPDFEDPIVQIIHDVLNDTDLPVPMDEHWEGFSARQIVANLLAAGYTITPPGSRVVKAGEMDASAEAVAFVAKIAWRTDPPNANRALTDAERLSAIKYHPTIKAAAEPHIRLAAQEALGGRDG